MGKRRALLLLSGGLDSILAAKVLQEQKVEVTGISFVTPFFNADDARRSATDLGIDIIVEDISDAHLEVVKRPPHGYGKCMNPCIDCHILMVRVAGRIMQRERFDFMATGEVLGERPMSQNFDSLMNVARASGCGDYLLRPLSAKLLPETKPEREGKVDRSRLMDIEGRSRRRQMEMVERYGIVRYVQPAGGCLLTDPHFSRRLRELLRFEPGAGRWNFELLRLGRHFRLGDGSKVVVGRDERDNRRIEESARPLDALIVTMSVPGPSSLIVEGGGEQTLAQAAALTASYGDASCGDVEMELSMRGARRLIVARGIGRSSWQEYKI